MPAITPLDRNRKQRSRAACTQCRRAKVKCGLGAIPCARCKRLDLECVWDPAFRRVRNQDRVSQLERQIQELHEQQAIQVTTSDTVKHSKLADPSSAQHRNAHIGLTGSTATVSPAPAPPEARSYCAGDISISQAESDSLFRIYFARFHPHAPFLEERAANEVYNSSELLFWAIVAVANRLSHLGNRTQLQSSLGKYLNNNANSLVLGHSRLHFSLAHVQTLLLISLWPPENVTFWADRSLHIVNLALSFATNIGLHCPGFEQEYSQVKVVLTDRDRAERLRTWAYCVALAQNLSMDLGIPCSVPFENGRKIQDLCRAVEDPAAPETVGIPKDILHYLAIHRMGYYWLHSLPSNSANRVALDDSDLVAALSSAEEAFPRLEDLPGLSLLCQLQRLAVFLHVRCMYFHLSSKNASRKAGVLRAYTTAKSLLTLAISGDNCTEVMRCSPKTTLRMLFLAACTIFCVVHSSYGAEIDYDASKLLAGGAQMCMRLQAPLPHLSSKDFPDRCADMYQNLWHLHEKDPGPARANEPTLAVRSRQGASIIFHCLAIYFDRLKHFEQRDAFEERTTNGSNVWDDTLQLSLWDSLSDFNWDFEDQFLHTNISLESDAPTSAFVT